MVIGLYVGGSVTRSGRLSTGVSDVDVVALVDRTPDPGIRRAIVGVHRGLIRSARAAAVHCVYVPQDDAGAPACKRGPGPSGELFRRP